MLDLHEIHLTAEDKHKLKQLCETKNASIKYREALALISVNRNLNEDGTPVRHNQGFWVLQIP